jgi:hypothetical protein
MLLGFNRKSEHHTRERERKNQPDTDRTARQYNQSDEAVNARLQVHPQI